MPRSPSGASARPSPRVSIKSLELNALHTSQIQDMVHLNGNRSSGRHFPFHLKLTLSWICSPSGSIDEARFLDTIAKRDEPSVQARCHFLAKTRDVIGEIENLS